LKLEHSFTVPADLDTVWQAVLDPERVAPCMPGATLTEVEGDAFKGAVKVKLGPISLLYKGSGEFLSKDEPTRTVVIKASGKDSRGNGTAAATVTVALTAAGTSTTGTVNTDLSITGKPAQFGRGLISEVGGKILDTFATCLAAKLAPPTEEPPAPENQPATENPPTTKKPSAAEKPMAAEQPSASEKPSAAEESLAAATPPVAEKPLASAKPAATEKPPAAKKPRTTEKLPKLSVVENPPPATPENSARATGKHAGEEAAAHAPAATKPRLAPAPEPESEPIDLLAYAGPSVLKRVAPLIAVIAAVVTFIALRRRR
jgi:carbon monoxide dehydrogenase subunit G